MIFLFYKDAEICFSINYSNISVYNIHECIIHLYDRFTSPNGESVVDCDQITSMQTIRYQLEIKHSDLLQIRFGLVPNKQILCNTPVLTPLH